MQGLSSLHKNQIGILAYTAVGIGSIGLDLLGHIYCYDISVCTVSNYGVLLISRNLKLRVRRKVIHLIAYLVHGNACVDLGICLKYVDKSFIC